MAKLKNVYALTAPRQRKVPVTFKCDPTILDDFEKLREALDYPLQLTAFIETAMRRELDRQRSPNRK